MSVDELLSALAKRSHAGRMAYMADYGRSATASTRSGAARREVVATLERGGFFERAMALQSCYGSRDRAHVLRALGDPSRKLRGLATKLAPLVCDDAQLLQALRLTPRRSRAHGLAAAVRQRRRAVVDLYLAELEAAGDPDLLALLPYGSESFVGPRLERAAAEAGAAIWARLGRLHPEMTAARLSREGAAADGFNPRLARRAEAALPYIADHSPDLAINLATTLTGQLSLASLPLDMLAKQRPQAVTNLILTRPGDGVSSATAAILAGRLINDEERLAALVNRFGGLGATAAAGKAWLRRLPVEGRRAAYRVASRGWRDEHGALPPDLIALLPGPEREAEARRNWSLPVHRTRPRQQLRYAGLLPYDEAKSLLEPFLRDSDAELRAGALAALVHAVRYSRSQLADLLALVRSRGNEQDPVRLAMLGALAALPPSVFAGHALAQLNGIMRQALDAADLSLATAQALERLVVRLLPMQPAWAVSALEMLMRERGSIVGHGVAAHLTENDVRRLAPAVWPVVQSWATREREHQIVALAGLVGRRLASWDDLVDLLETLVASSRDRFVSVGALQLIAEHRPDRFSALVPALLRRDPSWITQAIVHDHLHEKRQDLLDPFLGSKAWKGRFSTGKTRTVLPFRKGFERWLPRQQLEFARTVEEVIADAERDSPAVLVAVDQLSALPDAPVGRLVALAALDNPRTAARDRALGGLARRDGGDGLDALISALGDARARIAIYALRSALRDRPAAQVVPLLRATPRDRVTVLKEVVRLAGEQAGEDAYRFLLELDGESADAANPGGGLHRDVRIALLRALWDHLEQDPTWPILQRAAAAPDPAVAIAVARISPARLSQAADERLSELLAGLLGRPEPAVRLEVLKRLASLALGDSSDALGAPILRALASDLPDEIAAAATALVATRAGRKADQLGAAVLDMLPNRRALATLTNALSAWLAAAQVDAAPAAKAVLFAMAADPLTVGLRIQIALAGLSAGEIVDTFTDQANKELLHAGALASAVARVQTGTPRRPPEVLEALQSALADSDDERLRRLALAALIGLSRTGGGWTDDRLAQLHRFRADTSTLVAEAAQFTFTAP